jgi:hypothetical protein
MSENSLSDEDKMIKKWEEHRDAKNMVIEIGKLNNICVTPTTGNDENGDFFYDEDQHDKLIKCLDEHLGDYKYE